MLPIKIDSFDNFIKDLVILFSSQVQMKKSDQHG